MGSGRVWRRWFCCAWGVFVVLAVVVGLVGLVGLVLALVAGSCPRRILQLSRTGPCSSLLPIVLLPADLVLVAVVVVGGLLVVVVGWVVVVVVVGVV